MIALELRHFIFFERRYQGAVAVIEPLLRRRHGVRIRIQKMLAVRGHAHAVRAVLVRQLHRLSARKRHAIKLPLDGTLFRCGEIDRLRLLIHFGYAVHLPIAARELRDLFAC